MIFKGIRKTAAALILSAGVAIGAIAPPIVKPIIDKTTEKLAEKVYDAGQESGAIPPTPTQPAPPVAQQPPTSVQCTVEVEAIVISSLRDHITDVCGR